jgi:hypothetical protein
MIRSHQPPLYVTSLPTSPYDGQEVFLVGVTPGTVNHYRFNGTTWEVVSSRAEGWHEVGGPGQPAFQNGWVNDGTAGLETAGFCLELPWVVRLKGRVKGGVVTSPIFTLPATHRPPTTSDHPVVSNFAFGRVTIASNGNVILGVGSNTWASLSGITFRI